MTLRDRLIKLCCCAYQLTKWRAFWRLAQRLHFNRPAHEVAKMEKERFGRSFNA